MFQKSDTTRKPHRSHEIRTCIKESICQESSCQRQHCTLASATGLKKLMSYLEGIVKHIGFFCVWEQRFGHCWCLALCLQGSAWETLLAFSLKFGFVTTCVETHTLVLEPAWKNGWILASFKSFNCYISTLNSTILEGLVVVNWGGTLRKLRKTKNYPKAST